MYQKVGDISNSNVSNVNISKNNTVKVRTKSSTCGCFTEVLFVANCVLFVVNLFYTCNYYPRVGELEFDYIGIIVGIFSLLVTILLGWQIFNTISIFNEVKSKIDNLEKENQKAINTITADAKYSSIAVSLAQLGVSQFHQKDYENAIRSLFNAIIFCQKITTKDEFYSETYDNAIATIVELSRIGSEVWFDSQEEVELFQEAAMATGNKEVIAFAMKFEFKTE